MPTRIDSNPTRANINRQGFTAPRDGQHGTTAGASFEVPGTSNEEVEVAAAGSGADVKVVRQTMRKRLSGRDQGRSVRLLEKVARRLRQRA